MRLRVHVIEIAVQLKLFITNFVVEGRVASPSFLLWIRAGEQVKIETRKQTAKGANATLEINVIAGRRQSIGVVRRSTKLNSSWIRRRIRRSSRSNDDRCV